MAKATFPVLLLVLLLFSSPGENVKLVNGEKNWCVARPSTGDQALQNNIDYACNHVNCSIIEPDGSCFYPNIAISHASVVMNLYYQAKGRNYWNCNFTNSALVVITDPSYGNCKYA